MGEDRDMNNDLSEDDRSNLSLLSERPPRAVMESALNIGILWGNWILKLKFG